MTMTRDLKTFIRDHCVLIGDPRFVLGNPRFSIKSPQFLYGNWGGGGLQYHSGVLDEKLRFSNENLGSPLKSLGSLIKILGLP